jgi:hypothetical protein
MSVWKGLCGVGSCGLPYSIGISGMWLMSHLDTETLRDQPKQTNQAVQARWHCLIETFQFW